MSPPPAHHRGRRLTRRAALAAIASLAAALAGCGDDGSGPPRREVVLAGTYGVVEVNARSLPVTLRLPDRQTGTLVTLAFTAGDLVLREDGTYTLTLVVTPQNGSPAARGDAGTYQESGGRLTLRSSLGAEGSGAWSGHDITLTIALDLDGDGDLDSDLDLLGSKSPG